MFSGGSAGASGTTPTPTGLDKVQHIVVIYLENWSFDSLYGLFPGADGLAQATSAPPQVGQDGQPYPTLPQVLATAPGDRGDEPLRSGELSRGQAGPAPPGGHTFPGGPPQPTVLAGPVRPGDGEGRRPRGQLLPGAGRDRRREDGPLRPGRQIRCSAARAGTTPPSCPSDAWPPSTRCWTTFSTPPTAVRC